MRILYLSPIVLVLFAFCGCGGGGSGGQGGLALSLNPSSLSGTLYEGETKVYHVVGTAQGSVAGSVYAIIRDEGAVFSPIAVTRQSDGTYAADLTVAISLPQGEQKNVVTVRLCGDANCAQQYASANLNYDFNVLPSSNLTPLTKLDGVSDWTTIGGSAAHTGFVPATFNVDQFSPRWSYFLQFELAEANLLPEAATTNGVVFFPEATDTAGASTFDAVEEADGSLASSGSIIGGCASVSGVSLVGSSFYASAYNCIRNEPPANDYVISGNAGTSASQFLTAYPRSAPGGYNFPAQAPVVVGGEVVSMGGNTTYGAVAVDAKNGTNLWQSELGGNGGSSPASDGVGLYAVGPLPTNANESYLIALDPANGAMKFNVDLLSQGDFPITPVLVGGTGDALISTWSALVDVDIAAKSIKWSIPGKYAQRPAIGNGVVYVLAGTSSSTLQLEARKEMDGTLLWSWPAGTPGPNSMGFDVLGAPIVTNNLVFLSTDAAVYAVDLTTHQSVWTYSHPGRLAISANGILYISRQDSRSGGSSFPSDGYLTAFNLH